MLTPFLWVQKEPSLTERSLVSADESYHLSTRRYQWLPAFKTSLYLNTNVWTRKEKYFKWWKKTCYSEWEKMNTWKVLFPWPLCSYNKVCFLQYWQFSDWSAFKHICGSLGETVSSCTGLRSCSLQSRTLCYSQECPAPHMSCRHPATPLPASSSTADRSPGWTYVMFIGKAQSSLLLLFLKSFNPTQTAKAGGISQPSTLLPSFSLLAQPTIYRLKCSKLWSIKSFTILPQNGL